MAFGRTLILSPSGISPNTLRLLAGSLAWRSSRPAFTRALTRAATAISAVTHWALPSSLARSSSLRAFTRALALAATAISAVTHWALPSSLARSSSPKRLHSRSRARCHRYLCGYSLGSPQLSLARSSSPRAFTRALALAATAISAATHWALPSSSLIWLITRSLPGLSRPDSCGYLSRHSPALAGSLAWRSSRPAFTRALALAATAISAATLQP